MIGLDTNVVVRYLVQDDPDQAATATALIDGLTKTDPGFISLVAVVEVHWVLRRAYRVSAIESAEVIDGLLHARELRVGQDDVVQRALAVSRAGVDFADAVIAELGRAAGCDHTLTFDRRAAHADQMQLLSD